MAHLSPLGYRNQADNLILELAEPQEPWQRADSDKDIRKGTPPTQHRLDWIFRSDATPFRSNSGRINGGVYNRRPWWGWRLGWRRPSPTKI